MEVQRNCPIEKTEKCTKLSALIVVRNVKSPSNQIQADQYTAANVGKKDDHQEDADINQVNPPYYKAGI